MSNIKTRKTALYIRVSTDSQFEEGYSVDAQKEKLEQYCKLKDIEKYDFYIDGGWSGSNIDRPEMKRMMNEIIEKKIESVIVYKLDRLSRSQKDTVFLLEDVFIPNNCNFISLNENFDTTTPYGKAMIGILSVFAQLERENIRERTRMGMYERVKSGLWMGGGRIPFGYDYDPSKDILVPNEHAEEVKQIFELYTQGYSSYELSKMFPVCNDSHINKILTRETYRGKINFRGEIFDSQHEAIISDELWDKAQLERKKRNDNKRVYTQSEYLLTGLVRCGKCGAKMRYQKWGKNSLKIYCYSQQTSKPKLIKDPNCDNARIDASDLEHIVILDLLKRTENVKSVDKVITLTTSSLEILKNKYNVLVQKIKKLYNLYAASEDDLLLETINENKRELEYISKQIEREITTEKVSKEINDKHQVICNLKDKWNSMTVQEKKKALSICIKEIVVTDNAVDINYNF